MNQAIFVFPFLLALSSWAGAATYHVAPQALGSVAPEMQFRTIGEAAKKVVAGDVVLIHSGIYREGVVIEANGTQGQPIRFEAAPGASVEVTGADVLSNWRKEPGAEDNVFSTEWPHKFLTFSKTMAHPDDEEHRLIGRTEQVIVGGYLLRQVLSRDKVTWGTFFADTDGGRLYVQTANNMGDLSKTTVEASTHDTVWDCRGSWVQTRGLRFRYAAIMAQHGMARFTGAHDSALDCVFEEANSVGASFEAPDLEIRRCTFQNNGQLGFRTERAHRLHMVDCLTQNNNVKNFERGWEAGGNKIVLSRDVVIEGSRFLHNRGAGIWFDIGNENAEVRNCLIADNEDAGITYEISKGLHAHDNIFLGNGLAATPGPWGFDGGLSVSSSPDCVVERNLFIGNKEGFQFREYYRYTPFIDDAPGTKEHPIWNHDETIQNNVFALNRDAGVWAWFDVPDERQWPVAMRQFNGRERNAWQSQADYDKQQQENIANGYPINLTLDQLNIRFTNNVYDLGDTGAVFHWGTSWRHNQYFDGPTALEKLRASLGFEQGSLIAPFTFADSITRDFRVPANSAALKMKAYPQGTIPDAMTGVLNTLNPAKVR
ncbi:hypothetical protein IAD21_00994 [Abditibacteriota bacterium]|nr:hypothetical protein IAD21_00994 [Abditibacteriota bacterium]